CAGGADALREEVIWSAAAMPPLFPAKPLSLRLPHRPQQMTEVIPSRLAGRHDEQLRDLQLERVGVEKDEHLADEARAQRHVVVRADAEAESFLFPPGEGVVAVVRELAGQLLVR